LSSYRQIFKSTALVGGSQGVTILFGILKNKVLAVLLGPSGLGLSGTFLTAAGFVGGLTGLGLGASGVRQIAEAAAAGDDLKLARTTLTLRRASLFTGALGMLVVLTLCVPLSRMTFGDTSRSGGLALMSLTLLCGSISAGQLALLQGLRRLKDLTKSQIAGSLFGSISGIVFVFFMGERGVAPFLVANAVVVTLCSFWYARKVSVQLVTMTWAETFSDARGMLDLGIAFVVQNLVIGAGAYFSRVLIIDQLGMGAVGLFTATWTLSSYYVNIVLSAMGTDFYPRLTGAANDHPAMNKMVNEQIEMGLLLAVPGVLGIMALAPVGLKVLYSGAFVSGTEIIRWQILGVFLRVVAWPMGYVQLAKGKSKLFMITETTTVAVGLGFLLVSLRWWKAEGIGIAFFAANVVMTVYQWAVSWRLSGFAWSNRCLKTLIPASCGVAAVFLAQRLLPPSWAITSGVIITAIVALLSLVLLQRRLGIDLRTLIPSKFGIAPNPG
jgi:PST family polysaccharide transporter